LGEGDGIQECDHPSFRDPVYRKRREEIQQLAMDYRLHHPHIPFVNYNKEEIETWNYCYTRLKKLLAVNACEETNQTISDMEKHIEGFGENSIP